MNSDRRVVLALIGVTASLALARPLSGRAATRLLSQDKFESDGRVRPYRGNTVICHFDQQGDDANTFHALLDIYRELPIQGFSSKYAILPPSSYHMTVFVGANDPERTPGLWPEGVPLDAPIETCNRILAERLRAHRVGAVAPIRMRVDQRPIARDTTALTIRLVPFDDAEELKLRRLRDQLSDILKIKAPTHGCYRFHTTLGYPIRPLEPREQAEFVSCLSRWHAMVAERVPGIVLGQPEYCTFEDMFAFDRQFYI
jgi:hypothetical protein